MESSPDNQKNNTEDIEGNGASSDWNMVSWSGLLKSVQKTTETVADVIKKDLTEFAEVGQGFAKGILMEEDIKKTAEQKANQSAFENALNSLDDGFEKAEQLAMAGLSNLMNVGTSFFTVTQQPISKQQTISDRFTQQVLEAALDQKTYIEPFGPENSAAYVSFSKSFDQIAHAGKIALVIDSQPNILILMKKIVPHELSEEEFWRRYYFRISELELEQKTRSLIVASNAPLNSDHNEVAWSSSDEDEDVVIISKKQNVDLNDGNLLENKDEKDVESESIPHQTEFSDLDIISSEETASIVKKENIDRDRCGLEEKEVQSEGIPRQTDSDLISSVNDDQENTITPPIQSNAAKKDDDWDGWDT